MTTAKFKQFIDEHPDQLNNAMRLLMQGFLHRLDKPIDEHAITAAVTDATPFSRMKRFQLDYWRTRVEFEWLVANVPEEGLQYLCDLLRLPEPTLPSRLPYITMFTLIRNHLRERFPFDNTTRAV